MRISQKHFIFALLAVPFLCFVAFTYVRLQRTKRRNALSGATTPLLRGDAEQYNRAYRGPGHAPSPARHSGENTHVKQNAGLMCAVM